MHTLYLQCPSCTWFDPWDIKQLLSLLGSWTHASSILNLKLVMDQIGHHLPRIHTESHSNVNHCPVCYLKAYLFHTEPFRKKSDGSELSSLFLGSNKQHMSVCTKINFFLAKECFMHC